MYSLIDINETGFYLKPIATKYGRIHTTSRVRYLFHYRRKERKGNVIMAMEPGNPNLTPEISGSLGRPRRWVYISQDNTDQFIFGEYTHQLLTNIETHPVPGGYDDERCLFWDNLSIHKAAYVTTIIRYHPSPKKYILSIVHRTVQKITYQICIL